MTNSQRALLIAAQVYTVDSAGALYGPRGRLYPKINKNGYPHLTIVRVNEGINQKIMVHRIAAYQKFGDRLFAPGVMVRHLDCNKLNFSPDNLELGTNADNFRDNPEDVVRKVADAGRQAAIAKRKLSDAEVQALRADRASRKVRYHNKELALKYGISKSSVRDILSYKTYRTSTQAAP